MHIWKTGDKYEGEWKNGQVSGYGKYTNSNGEIVEGIFESGNLIKSKETIDQERQIQEKAQEERILQLAKQKEEEKKQQEEQNIRNAALLMYLFKIAAENQKSLTKNQTSKTNLNTNSANDHQSVSHEPKWIDVKCTNCNVEFKFKIWKGGQYESGNYWGGWGDETNTRSGYVKCKGCTGYGINWDYDGKNPTKTNCKNWSCSNGWDKCSKCNGTGTVRELH